jgi:hemerythrin
MEFEPWEWSLKMTTGNESLDYSHQSLINIVNDIVGAYNSSNGDPSPILIEVPLDELFKFAAHHFAGEELVMKNYKYRNLIEHHELHINFVLKLIDLKISFDKDQKVAKELLEFLFSWRDQHIQIKDIEAMSQCR